jgi:chromosome segregation ATPase
MHKSTRDTNVKLFPDYLHMLQPQRALANHDSADQWNGRVKAISRQIDESQKAVQKRLAENAKVHEIKFEENISKMEEKNKGLDNQIQKICDNQEKLSKEVGQVETKMTETVQKMDSAIDKMKNFDTLLEKLGEVLSEQKAGNEKQAANNSQQLTFAEKVEKEVGRGVAVGSPCIAQRILNFT